jgi:hypothetical protein
MTAVGGFATVRFRACNLESGHSAYGVAGPLADCRLSRATRGKQRFVLALSLGEQAAAHCTNAGPSSDETVN